MFCVTVVTLASVSITAELFYVAAVLVITVLCPAWFIRLQGLKKYVTNIVLWLRHNRVSEVCRE